MGALPLRTPTRAVPWCMEETQQSWWLCVHMCLLPVPGRPCRMARLACNDERCACRIRCLSSRQTCDFSKKIDNNKLCNSQGCLKLVCSMYISIVFELFAVCFFYSTMFAYTVLCSVLASYPLWENQVFRLVSYPRWCPRNKRPQCSRDG